MRHIKIIIIVLFCFANFFVLAQTKNNNKGNITNIVVFARFSNDNEYENRFHYYDSMFNSPNALSLYNYYDEVSYNQLKVNTYFLHKDTIISYKDKYSCNYYAKQTSSNPIGYENSSDAAFRKSEFLRNIFKFIQANITNDINIDADSNGFIDNVMIISKGYNDVENLVMFPHYNVTTNSEYAFTTSVNGKQSNNYVMLSSESIYLGLICHEFFHTLGAPDLYHSDKLNSLTPVFFWDLMENQYIIPQSMSAYMKFKYGKWIENIPNITLPGEYYLNPLTQKDTNCYTISAPYAKEYVVLEYRNPIGKYESSLSSMLNTETSKYIKNDGGLLIYRINKDKEGIGNSGSSVGMPDEIYCYRPDGTNTKNGKPWNAAFNNRYGRGEFNKNSNPAPTRFDGSLLNISLNDIYESNGKLYFTAHSKDTTFIKYPTYMELGVSLKPVIRWDLLEGTRTYSVQISKKYNFTTLDVDNIVINDSLCYIKNTLSPDEFYYVRVGTISSNDTAWSKTTIFKTTKNLAILSNFTQYCAGANIDNIYYESIGNFNDVNIYLFAMDNIIKKPILLNSSIENGKMFCKIPQNIPTGYKYKLLFQEKADTNVKTYSPIFRIKGIPEAKLEYFDTTVCKNSVSTISFQAIDSNVKYINHSFEWQVKNGKILTTNDTNHNITIQWENVGIGEVKLIAKNDIGCRNEYSQNVYIEELPEIKFSAKNIVCPNVPIAYYCLDNKALNAKIEVTNGIYERKNRDTIYITWNNVDTGYIKIIYTINNYCSDSAVFKQNIKKIPDIAIIGADGFCKSDTAEYSVNINNTNDYLLEWNCNEGKIIGEQTQKLCKITSNKDTLNLYFTLVDKTTNCSHSITKQITLYNLPDTPIVNYVSEKLVCSVDAENYQWFFADKPIPNSNSKSIIPIDSGDYYVIVENKYGCKNKSLPYKILVSIYEENNDYKFTQNENIISLYFMSEENITMELYNLLGNKLLEKQDLQTKQVSYNISQYPAGVYLLRLYLENRIIHRVIIKY